MFPLAKQVNTPAGVKHQTAEAAVTGSLAAKTTQLNASFSVAAIIITQAAVSDFDPLIVSRRILFFMSYEGALMKGPPGSFSI